MGGLGSIYSKCRCIDFVFFSSSPKAKRSETFELILKSNSHVSLDVVNLCFFLLTQGEVGDAELIEKWTQTLSSLFDLPC